MELFVPTDLRGFASPTTIFEVFAVVFLFVECFFCPTHGHPQFVGGGGGGCWQLFWLHSGQSVGLVGRVGGVGRVGRVGRVPGVGIVVGGIAFRVNASAAFFLVILLVVSTLFKTLYKLFFLLEIFLVSVMCFGLALSSAL